MIGTAEYCFLSQEHSVARLRLEVKKKKGNTHGNKSQGDAPTTRGVSKAMQFCREAGRFQRGLITVQIENWDIDIVPIWRLAPIPSRFLSVSISISPLQQGGNAT